MSKNKRESLIVAILSKDGEDDSQEERAFLETLPLSQLELLAKDDDFVSDSNDDV